MARARIRATHSVSLFPFLAVLMCAMGALILLLIVITRRVREQTLARSAVVTPTGDEVLPVEPAAVPTLPKLHAVIPSPPETDRIMAASMAEVDKTDARRRAELQRLRAAYAALTAERRRLAARLAAGERKRNATQAQLRSLRVVRSNFGKKSEAKANRAGRLETEVRGQVAALDGLRRKLQALKLQKAETSSKFAIVPFDGRTGTTRRPIFIECTKDALRILPERVEITAEQLKGFSAYRNPVLAAARSLIQYWVSKRHTGSADEPRPYVLLLVRPGGSVAYYAARKMLRNLGEPIGYELIEADWKLKLPPVEPRAKAVCEAAVNRVLESQPADAGSKLAGRRAANGFGGPARTSRGSSRTQGGTTGSARRMRFNRATGRFEVVEPDTNHLLGPFGDALADHRGTGTTGGLRPDGVGSGGRAAKRFPAAKSRRSATGGGSRPGRRAAAASGSRKTATATANAGGPELRPERTGTGRQTSTGRQPSGHPEGTADGRGGGNGPGQPDDERLWPLKRDIDSGTAHNSGHPNGPSLAARGAHPPTTSDAQRSSDVVSSKRTAAGGAPQSGSPRTSGLSAFGVQRGNARSPNSKWRPRRRWGLSSPGATIGFEKEVRVWASVDQLLVGRQRLAVGQGETREQLLQSVVVAVGREVRAWGKPPDSFYWVPRVRFVISPGGNRHYERLRSPLIKLGLQTTAEYRLETPESSGITR
ncbi:MAG: hypothetical protein ACE5KM_12635 [Planctomycetaceae bacterium]